MSAFTPEDDFECFGEFIDGIWHGCGCPDCDQDDDDAIEADYESGAISYDEAIERHTLNDATR